MIHVYSIIIFIALCLGLGIAWHESKQLKIKEDLFWDAATWIILSGVIGARLYHVLTAWTYYQNSLNEVFQIWQGGLSIIGAVIGGVIGWMLYLHFARPAKVSVWTGLDLAALAMPFAQAIGRWGNYFNQELYGSPSQLPWAIFIESNRRLSGYQQFSTFHPLFLYEMFGSLVIGFILWKIYRSKRVKVGSGNLFLIYVGLYCALRFCLDFLRIGKTMLGETGFGLNQIILLVFLVSVILFSQVRERIKR